MDNSEEFEHIPWSQLGADPGPRRQRLAYLAAAALVAVALGAVVVRAVGRPAAAPAPTSVVTTTPAAAETSALADLPPPNPALPEVPFAYSEADLMAVPAADAPRAAIARAEWFVVDYFTADRDPLGSLDLRKALPAGAELPALPHDGGDAISYVEWARAVRSEEVGPGLFRVTVAFRAIAAPDGAALDRLPVQAVDVVVAVTGGGEGWAVVDLPSPSPLPVDTGFDPWPAAAGQPPADVAAAALESAVRWGDSPEVLGAASASGGWRVVVTVADAAGTRWPLSLWLDGDEVVTSPPWTEE